MSQVIVPGNAFEWFLLGSLVTVLLLVRIVLKAVKKAP